MSKVLTTYKRPSIRDMIKSCVSTNDVTALVKGSEGLFLKGKMSNETYTKIVDASVVRYDELLSNKS